MQSLRNLLNGVSQQPAALRLPSQAEEQVNMLSSATRGLRKRPFTNHVARLTATITGFTAPFIHRINRSASERWDVVIANDDLKVYDAITGAESSVIFPNGKSYLTGTTDFRGATVGDFTFLVNRAKTVLRGTTKAAATVNEALVYVRQADYSTQYSVTLGTTKVSVVTADSSHPAGRASISTNNIAADLITVMLRNAFISGFFKLTQFGSTIHITRTDGKPFALTVSDGLSDKGLKAVQGVVQSIADLPARAKHGMVVEIAGDPDSKADNYWVQYDNSTTPQQAGVWRECPKPGTITSLDANTMPWALMRRGIVLPQGTHVGHPSVPVISIGATVTYTDGWTADADTLASVDPTSDVLLSNHQQGLRTTVTGTSGDQRNLRVAYDVDTSLVEHGIVTEVRLLHKTGTGAFTKIDSRFYGAGTMAADETMDINLTLAVGDMLELRVFYGTRTTPPTYRRAIITAHGSINPGAAGVTNIRSDSTEASFPPSEIYPVGTVVTITCDGTAFTHTVATTDGTGTSVATAMHGLIDPHASFNSTNPSAGVVRVSRATGTRPDLTSTVALPANTLFDTKLTMVAAEHVGRTLRNLTDGSSGTISANGVRTVTAPLAGGGSNIYQAGDICEIVGTGAYFVFDRLPWNTRGAGDLEIVPFPSYVDKTISEVFFYQNRLGFTCEENVVLSASGDLYNFFRYTATALLASDVIDVKSALARITRFHSAVVMEAGLFLFSDNGVVRCSGDPLLTPSTIRMDPVGDFEVGSACRPIAMGTRVYFTRTIGSTTRVLEFTPPVDETPGVATDITLHVPTYCTGTAMALVGDFSQGFMALLTTGGVYVYNFHYEQDTKVQSAWSSWTFSGATVKGLSMSSGVLSLIPLRSDGLYLENMDIGNPPAASANHRDRAGHASPVTYLSSYSLSTLFRREDDGEGIVDRRGRLQVRYLTLYCVDSGFISVEVTSTGRSTVQTTLPTATPRTVSLRVPVMARNDTLSVFIADASTTSGWGLAGIDWEGEYVTKSRRI